MVTRLTLFLTVWDKGCLVNCLFCKLQGLREEKMDKFIANEKYLVTQRALHKLIRWDFAPNTRAEILKSFYKVCPLNKLKESRYYQIGVTWISLLESFHKSFISLVPLLIKRKFEGGLLKSFLSKLALPAIGDCDPVSLQILCGKYESWCNIFGVEYCKNRDY